MRKQIGDQTFNPFLTFFFFFFSFPKTKFIFKSHLFCYLQRISKFLSIGKEFKDLTLMVSKTVDSMVKSLVKVRKVACHLRNKLLCGHGGDTIFATMRSH